MLMDSHEEIHKETAVCHHPTAHEGKGKGKNSKSYAVTSSSCRRGCQAAVSTRQEMALGLTDEVSVQEQQQDHITDGSVTDEIALVG